tara:strand:+ start:7 stop:1113 length:1107 start_codon:yes stop_codon:yes gene_type:complete
MKDQDNPGYNNNIVLRNGNFGFAKNGETTIIINSERLMLDFMNILSNRDVIKQAILEMSVTLNNIDGSEDDKELKASQIAQEFRVDGQNISFSTSLELNEYQPILQKAFELAEQEVKKRILKEVDSLINLLTYTSDYKVNRIESEILLLTQNYETQNQIRNKLQLREILLAKQKRIKILEDHYKIVKNIELADIEKKDFLLNKRELDLRSFELRSFSSSNADKAYNSDVFPHYLRGIDSIGREIDLIKNSLKNNLSQNMDLEKFTSQPPKIANLKILLKRLKTKLSYQIAEIDRVIKKTPLRNDTFKAVSYNTNLISFVKEKAIVNEITFSTSPFKKIVFTFFLFGLIFSLILAVFINGFNNFMKRKS